jgi:hypothetical protein
MNSPQLTATTLVTDPYVRGWLCQDKWGLSWQRSPIVLTQAVFGPDPAAAKRAFDAMMTIEKDRRRCDRGGNPRLTFAKRR